MTFPSNTDMFIGVTWIITHVSLGHVTTTRAVSSLSNLLTITITMIMIQRAKLIVTLHCGPVVQ